MSSRGLCIAVAIWLATVVAYWSLDEDTQLILGYAVAALMLWAVLVWLVISIFQDHR